MKNIKDYIIIGLLITIGFLLIKSHFSTQLREKTDLLEAANATLETFRNENGEQVAKIQVLESRNADAFLTLKTQDSTLLTLQQEVKKNQRLLRKQGSVTVIGGETRVDTVFQTNPVTVVDTIDNIVYPRYDFNVDLGGWVTGTGQAAKDSTSLDLKIKNEYTVVVGREKESLFKKSKPFVEVTNKNPYTITENLRTYQVSLPPQKRIGIGLSGGINQQLDPYVGIGINYNLIEF